MTNIQYKLLILTLIFPAEYINFELSLTNKNPIFNIFNIIYFIITIILLLFSSRNFLNFNVLWKKFNLNWNKISNLIIPNILSVIISSTLINKQIKNINLILNIEISPTYWIVIRRIVFVLILISILWIYKAINNIIVKKKIKKD